MDISEYEAFISKMKGGADTPCCLCNSENLSKCYDEEVFCSAYRSYVRLGRFHVTGIGFEILKIPITEMRNQYK